MIRRIRNLTVTGQTALTLILAACFDRPAPTESSTGPIFASIQTSQSDDFASGNSITGVGGTAEVNLNPAGASENIYTVHYFVTTTINGHSSQFGTATLVLAIETNDGSGWVERSTYTYQCSYLSGPPPYPARTCTGSPGGGPHEQKSLTVAGLGLDDDIRLRAKTFSTNNGAAGSFVVRGGDAGGSNPETYNGVTYTGGAAPNGTPDPMRLPDARLDPGARFGDYDALRVWEKDAGYSYLDPTTGPTAGVRIYKLTSGNFPDPSGPSWGHDYAEGGDEISLPYMLNGLTTRTVLVRDIDHHVWWFVDFRPGVGVVGARQLSGSLKPYSDLAFTFSSNPQTPYYAYVSTGTQVKRIDIRNPVSAADGDGWPRDEINAGWLHQSENDDFFTWVSGTPCPPDNLPCVVGYVPSTSLRKSVPVANLDQPQINRKSGARQVAINNANEQMLLWDFMQGPQGTIICTTPGSDPNNDYPQFNHMAALRDRWMGLNWNKDSPHDYHQFRPDVLPGTSPPQCAFDEWPGAANADGYYGNGSWNQPQAAPDDQWALFSIQKGLEPHGGGAYIAPGGMVYVKANGERRLLGYPYNTVDYPDDAPDAEKSAKYPKFAFVKQSSDGRYVLFTSNMNQPDGSRMDVFLVEVPLR